MSLSQEQIDALHKHHDWAIASLDAAYRRLKALPRDLQTEGIKEHIAYFRHARQAFRWSKTFIGKNLKVQPNGSGPDIPHTD